MSARYEQAGGPFAVNVGVGIAEIISRLRDLQDADDNRGNRAEPPSIPLIDPTANVIKLVDAAIARQDDLRRVEFKRIDDLRLQQIAFDKEIAGVTLQGQKDLSLAESRRIDALTLAESRRIDALLAAATNNVALAAEKSSAQAATLATQVISSAEALRNQVATTTAATTSQIATMRESLEKRLALVEQNQYQGVGVATQRSEGRQQSQWNFDKVLAILAVLISLAVLFFKTR
jgi:hypothetical protein